MIKGKRIIEMRLKTLSIFLIVFSFAFTTFGQKEIKEVKEVEEYSLISPYDAIYTHFEFLQDYNYHPEIAAKPFMQSGISEEQGKELAIKLKQIFDGKVIYLDEDDFPKNADYLDSASRRSKYVLFRQLPEVYVVKVGNKWLYSEKTIESIERLFKQTYPYGTDKLLNLLPKIGNDKYFGLYTWQLIGILLLLLICFILHKILTFLVEKFLLRILIKVGRKNIAKK